LKHFITITQAKERAHRLQTYIYLAETFEASNVEEHIIQQYSYLGSLSKFADKMNYEIEVDDVRDAILAKTNYIKSLNQAF